VGTREGGFAIVEDEILGGTLRLRQPATGHRAGTDAVLLGSFAGDRGATRVVDLGAGIGTVGLIVARRNAEARITLVERDPALAMLAHDNIALNGLDRRATVLVADIAASAAQRRAAGLHPGSFDCAVSNPPWFEAGAVRASPDPGREAAHVLDAGSLDLWVRAATDLLVAGGTLAMIHRADALPRLFDALGGRFGSIVLRFVHPRDDKPAIRVLVRAIKGSRAPLAVLPPLALHGLDGRFTAEAAVLHGGG